MRTIKAYERSDIDLDNNPVHKMLADSLAVAFASYIRDLEKMSVSPVLTKEEVVELFSGAVARFLTVMGDRYEIVDSEKRDAITSVENLFGFPSGGWHENKDPEN